MAVVRKKQDDKYLKALRELVTSGGGNRQCFDCGQKGPTYVNMTIGSFVCTRCSGVLRGLTPPHRVKSISMATFTQDEIDFLKAHGNDACAKTWLGLWDPKRVIHQDHRELMIDKYERKRYYLEPASPLKSLTNATSLKSNNNNNNNNSNNNNNNNNNNSSSNSNNSATSNGQHAHNLPLTNGYGHKLENGFQSIQLTPPTSQRNNANSSNNNNNSNSGNNATMNGTHKSSSSSVISRPQHTQLQNGYHHQQQQQQQDAFMTNGLNAPISLNRYKNGLNGLNASIGSASTGALSDTSSCASNGFGSEADFVADFNSANIFDATSASSVGSPAVSSASSVASTNGYAKVQPIKTAQEQFMNGHANAQMRSNGTAKSTTENFADFDHAPIYNAAGLPIPNNNNRGSAAATSANNNNKLSSTPSEDRYAALKDLDEQLRESKAAVSVVNGVDAFGNAHTNNNNMNHLNGGVNPFKSQQPGVIVNPFQAAHSAQNGNNIVNNQQNQHPQNLYSQMTAMPSGGAVTQNGTAQLTTVTPAAATAAAAAAAATAFFNNYNNSMAGGAVMGGAPAGPNGCGFGFGTMQQQMAGNGMGMGVGVGVGAFNNPFAATGAMNSNNPFL